MTVLLFCPCFVYIQKFDIDAFFPPFLFGDISACDTAAPKFQESG